MKKYEFTGETKNHYGVTLRQIRALVTIIGVVSSGDVGGWIESENCLDHSGDAWVYGNAWVYGDALVSGDARVSGNAWVESMESICTFSGFGSKYRTTTVFIDSEIGIRIVCGCFTGTLEQFRKRVIETHGEASKNGSLYLDMANMIEKRLGDIK